MSQDRPTPPPPRPVPRRRRSARKPRGRPFRDAAIALLRTLIKSLEGTLERLEAEPQIPVRRRRLSGWVWGAIALTVICGVWIFWLPNDVPEEVAGRSPVEEIRPEPEPPEIAEVPESEPEPPEVFEVPEVEESVPEPEPEPEISEVEEIPEIEAPVPEPEPEISEVEESEPGGLPPELTAPEPPEPVALISAPAIARPYLNDSIRDRLAELGGRYGDDLIRSVDANFPASLLRVEVGDEWCDLEKNDRNRLSDRLFKTVRSLDFTRLELRLGDGKIIARSPVVGSEMILFNP